MEKNSNIALKIELTFSYMDPVQYAVPDAITWASTVILNSSVHLGDPFSGLSSVSYVKQ